MLLKVGMLEITREPTFTSLKALHQKDKFVFRHSFETKYSLLLSSTVSNLDIPHLANIMSGSKMLLMLTGILLNQSIRQKLKKAFNTDELNTTVIPIILTQSNPSCLQMKGKA